MLIQRVTQGEEEHEGNSEAEKPGILVKLHEKRWHARRLDQLCCDQKTRKIWQDCDKERKNRDPAKAVGETVFTVRLIERRQVQPPMTPDIIVGNHDSTDWTEQGAITNEPALDIALGVRDQLPRHNDHADDSSNQPTCAK